MTLFDAYLMVDWSAAGRRHPSAPRGDAVWIGEAAAGAALPRERYFRTRLAAVHFLESRLLEHGRRGRRVLAGFDFSFGFPHGLAAALHCTGSSPWRCVWRTIAARIEDNAANRNNRFQAASEINRIVGGRRPGPFWGCPARQTYPHLAPRSPGFPFPTASGLQLNRLRHCEACTPGVQETWGLYGAGRVGGQTLTGIPCLLYLREHPVLAPFTRVWPFETGFTVMPAASTGPWIVQAEIWPGTVKPLVRTMREENPELIIDRAQVRALCGRLAYLDRIGALADLFDRPAGLSAARVRRCVEEEGWILAAAVDQSPAK